jgi:glyoxylase-like metal-dependent hydrolase (beta-lactamase superfamily II)
MMKKPEVKAFFDQTTFTASYVVRDPETSKCAIIDPVLDFDPASGRTSTTSASVIAEYVEQNALSVDWILETHIHADHLTASPHLKQKLGGQTGVSDQVPLIQKTFSEIFNVEAEFPRDGSQFDRLFADGETFKIGAIDVKVIHTPGHTPACATYIIGDAAFVGDVIFMPDFGTARCDFPSGDARTLYRSIQRIFTLPDETRIFTCHDYKAPGRDQYAWESSLAEQKARNIHVGDGVSEDEFVKMREARDATLSMPKLILPSVQVNMRAGNFPPAESNGVHYMKLPINAL